MSSSRAKKSTIKDLNNSEADEIMKFQTMNSKEQ
jgi:hypothetical protein